ncbi:two-component sensor [Devosia pacifica]|uniref:histidine kinase n=2 Tax=Devosia pacifica TaxID=1335967 RepID=A0A918VQC7_9HYPH|nr:two-component sensor [Devosia pacifica]
MLDGPVPLESGPLGDGWRFDYLFALGSTSWVIHELVVLLAGLTLAFSGLGWWPWAWLLLMSIITVGMMLVSRSYLQQNRAPDAGERHAALHTALTAIAGIVWGGGAIMLVTAPAELVTFYTLVLGGTALGAVSSQHAWLRSCFVAIWTAMPLLMLAFLLRGLNLQHISTALMMLLYAVILSIMALRMHNFVTRNVDISRELASKIDALTATTTQLEQAHAEKSRFLAQASHDLRQPIHAIGLFVECLKGLRLGREGREILRSVDLSLESLTRLCRSLLDLAALDVGRVRASVAPVALDHILGEVVRQGSEVAREKNVKLTYVPTGLWVRTDAALLHTMVQNLVSNALKYAPGSRVLVGVRRRGETVAIEVIDTGPGIAVQDHARIFQEFVRLGQHVEHIDGLGLGLSIVSRLSQLLGLTISLNSAPGRGSRFSIAGLKLAPAGQTPMLPGAGYSSRLKDLSVLVIDDDDDVRESTARLLSRWGCTVQVVASASEIDPSLPIDFVLCDYELGGGPSGEEIIGRLRDARGRLLPAAIITGGRIESIGVDGKLPDITVLAKPVRPAQLRSVLLSAISAQTKPRSEATPAAAARVETSRARSKAET